MTSSVPLAKTNSFAQIFPLLLHYKAFSGNLKPDWENFEFLPLFLCFSAERS